MHRLRGIGVTKEASGNGTAAENHACTPASDVRSRDELATDDSTLGLGGRPPCSNPSKPMFPDRKVRIRLMMHKMVWRCWGEACRIPLVTAVERRHSIVSAALVAALAICVPCGTSKAGSPKLYTRHTLHNFAGNLDGEGPVAGLAVDANGVFYGTTMFGGPAGLDGGTVFGVTPRTGGQGWTYAVLYDFGVSLGDISGPDAGLAIGQNGVLFGATNFGGDLDRRGVRIDPPGFPGRRLDRDCATPLHGHQHYRYSSDGIAIGEGQWVQDFVLLPEAGNFLHPAHRFGDQMITVHLEPDTRVRFSSRALVWVGGNISSLCRRSSRLEATVCS
jgi:hypothetical protein